jgi:hypothetical protein
VTLDEVAMRSLARERRSLAWLAWPSRDQGVRLTNLALFFLPSLPFHLLIHKNLLTSTTASLPNFPLLPFISVSSEHSMRLIKSEG